MLDKICNTALPLIILAVSIMPISIHADENTEFVSHQLFRMSVAWYTTDYIPPEYSDLDYNNDKKINEDDLYLLLPVARYRNPIPSQTPTITMTSTPTQTVTSTPTNTSVYGVNTIAGLFHIRGLHPGNHQQPLRSCGSGHGNISPDIYHLHPRCLRVFQSRPTVTNRLDNGVRLFTGARYRQRNSKNLSKA